MKYLQCLAATLTISCLAGFLLTDQAQARGHHAAVGVEIISDQRGKLRKYAVESRRGPMKKHYVIARDHEGYRIRLHNKTGERIGVVVAVDGRNIISGRKSHLKAGENMYILNPYQTAEYRGWRSSRNHVNRFFFTNMHNSYAAAWGDSGNVGIIAVAAFKERYQQIRQDNHNNERNRRNRRMSGSPGTGYGESEWSASRKVSFSPRKKPMLKEFIKYEYRSTLCRRGVIRCQPPAAVSLNNHGVDHYGMNDFAPSPIWLWNNFPPVQSERGRWTTPHRRAERASVRQKEQAKKKFRGEEIILDGEMAEPYPGWGKK